MGSMPWWGWASLGVIVAIALGAVACLCLLRLARRASRPFLGVKPARPDATKSKEVYHVGAAAGVGPNAWDHHAQPWVPGEHRPQFVEGCRALEPYEPAAAATHARNHTPHSLQLGHDADKGWLVGQEAIHGVGMSSHRVDYLEDHRSTQPTRSRPPRQAHRSDGSTTTGQRRRSRGVGQILNTLRGSFGFDC